MAVVMAMVSMGIVSALTARGWAVLVQIALIRTILAAMILAAMILAATILAATMLVRNPEIAHRQGAKLNAMAQGARKLPASASTVSMEAV